MDVFLQNNCICSTGFSNKVFESFRRMKASFFPLVMDLVNSHQASSHLWSLDGASNLSLFDKMVKAWYMKNDGEEDQRSELHLDPPQYVNLEELFAKTGVLYWLLDAENYEQEGRLAEICEERNYNYKDFIELSKDKLENYDEKLRKLYAELKKNSTNSNNDQLKIFYKEHLHADEEIRFVLRGSGYFDVRDNDDKWIRILVTKGDLIILPAGIYHRFTLDHLNDIRVMRLFVGEPVWTPYNRPCDDHPSRKTYIENLFKSSNKIHG